MKLPILNQKGAALLIAVMLSSFLLTVVLTLTGIFTSKIKVSRDTRYSTTAIYAADSAIEYCLYVSRHQDPLPTPAMTNGALFTVTPPDCASLPLKATGSFRGVTRTLEIY
mgnify:CR=1 FL=1